MYPDGTSVKMGKTVTSTRAESLLVNALLRNYTPVMFKAIPMAKNFTSQQQAALISFTYNVVAGALEESPLRKRLMAVEAASTVISQEFPRWRYGDHRTTLAGLVRRRQAKIDLFVKRSNA